MGRKSPEEEKVCVRKFQKEGNPTLPGGVSKAL